MSVLFSGSCIGKAINVEFGVDNGGKPRVRWNMEVTEGEHKGKQASYSGKLDPDNIKFTKRDMMIIGWQGKDVMTFVSDATKASKPVPFNAEIATYNGSQWTSVKFGGGTPLAKPDGDTLSKVNSWFAETEGEASPF